MSVYVYVRISKCRHVFMYACMKCALLSGFSTMSWISAHLGVTFARAPGSVHCFFVRSSGNNSSSAAGNKVKTIDYAMRLCTYESVSLNTCMY